MNPRPVKIEDDEAAYDAVMFGLDIAIGSNRGRDRL